MGRSRRASMGRENVGGVFVVPAPVALMQRARLAWASLDGKLDEFHAGRAGEDTEGDYHGYLSDAAELAKRLEHRGYAIVRAGRDR